MYHASGQPTLPREDRGEGELGYGRSLGMHFGNKAAAIDRGMEKPNRQYVHTARLDPVKIMNVPQFTPVMSDEDANYSEEAERAVRFGAAVPYRNEFEGKDVANNKDNISYRVLPERTKTWSEDVQADPNAHPALKHLAEKGYNPTISMPEARREIDQQRAGANLQPQLFGADVVKGGKSVGHFVEPAEAFERIHSSGGGGGVRRNNLRPSFWQSDVAATVPPRLSRKQ